MPVQAAELQIGPMLFTLGAEQSAVMKVVESRFHIVSAAGQPDMFFLSEAKPPNDRIVGAIAFENGRFNMVQRQWARFDGRVTSTEVTKAIFAALESATAVSGSAATLSTQVQRVPGVEFKSIHFDFPGRRVTILAVDTDAKHQQVNITESISTKQR